MLILNPRLDLDRFFARLERAKERVLLVDYDGTLAPFHPLPERAAPYPHVAAILKAIGESRSSRIVMVSGRGLADLRGPLEHVPSADVWGTHGWQRRKGAEAPVDFPPTPSVRRKLDAAEARAVKLEAYGARVERKHAALAVHWRGLDTASVDTIRERLRRSWRALERQGLEVLEFDGGVELRARGRNKGHAVKKVLSECSPGAVCAYLGDDRTDEDAFLAIKRQGIAVLVRPSLRPTRADLWLEPPRELVLFLDRWRASAEATR